MSYQHLGKPRPLVDGAEKVTGALRYTADLKLPGMCYLKLILSPYAHARIRRIDAAAARAQPGVVAVLSAEDLPPYRIVSRNSALLAKERVLFAGQPVAVVVAETPEAAADAAPLVEVDYQPLPAVVTLEEAIAPDAPLVWPEGPPGDDDDMSAMHAAAAAGDKIGDAAAVRNASESKHYRRGEVAQGFAEAEVIVERCFSTASVHQGYLEPHAVIAEPGPLGESLTFYTSTQGQHSVRSLVAKLLKLPERQIRIRPLAVGGAFGAKYGIYEPLVGAVALAVGRPVKLVLSRSEDMQSTTPAPAMRIEVKAGARRDGTLTALEARILVDNGIFRYSHAGICAMLLGGYYRWQNLKIDAYEVHTHKGQVGAYRAPGAPQATFAIESVIDELAHKLGWDPLELRLYNAVEGGDLNGNNEPWPAGIGLKQVLLRLREHPLWQQRTPGTGIAVGGWPVGYSGAEALCRVDSDGTVRVEVGIVDISGVTSSLALVAAEAMGVSPEQVQLHTTDTEGAYGPYSGGSQVTYSTAGAVHEAVMAAKRQLVRLAAERFEAAEADIEIVDGHAQVKGVPARRLSLSALVRYGRKRYGGVVAEGRAAPPVNAPGFVAHLVKLSVDRATGVVTPERYVAVQDVGFALNPLMVEGQIHGGVVQGLGYALYEALRFDEAGQLLNPNFLNYALPRIDAVPPIEAILLENPSPEGPFGARGVGEPPITAGAAAVANAIYDACGVRLCELPITPQALWRALQQLAE